MTAFTPDEIDTLSRAIAHRRSLGLARLKPDAVDPEMIQRMLVAADWGPSHGDTEPWRYTVFTGESRNALGDAFAEAYRGDTDESTFKQITFDSYRDRALSAPVWISIGLTPFLLADGKMKMSMEEEMMAVACSVQNMHLMASAQGLAGMWHSKGISVHPRVAKFLGLEEPSKLLGFFFCGFPDVEWPDGERRPLSSKVTWA